MRYVTQVVTGFVTNSSSMICWFDRKLLEHPDVQAFMQAYGIGGGFVGDDLWHRGECSSIILTREQREEAQRDLRKYEKDAEWSYSGPNLGDDDDKIILIYGDEYSDLTSEFSEVLAKAMGFDSRWDAKVPSQDYN